MNFQQEMKNFKGLRSEVNLILSDFWLTTIDHKDNDDDEDEVVLSD